MSSDCDVKSGLNLENLTAELMYVLPGVIEHFYSILSHNLGRSSGHHR